MLRQDELERTRNLYPLFGIEYDEGNDLITVQLSRNCSLCDKPAHGKFSWELMRQLDNEHMKKSIEKRLMEIYPDLHVSVHTHKNGIMVSLWVDRDGRDAEGMGELPLVELNFHEEMSKKQAHAEKSKQEDWFYCSGHGRAEPKSEYGYFYFAGRYCKKYGEENPEHRGAAGRERYN